MFRMAAFGFQRRHLGHTALVVLLGIKRAAGMERAARRRVAGAGHFAGENDALIGLLGIGLGHRRQQATV